MKGRRGRSASILSGSPIDEDPEADDEYIPRQGWLDIERLKDIT